MLQVLTPALNRCLRCGELVTNDELQIQTVAAMKAALFGPARN